MTISDRKTARLVGWLFLGTFIFSIPGYLLYGPLLDHPTYILGDGHDTQITVGALLEILTAICNIGTAIALYPVARRYAHRAALGYVALRIVEGTIRQLRDRRRHRCSARRLRAPVPAADAAHLPGDDLGAHLRRLPDREGLHPGRPAPERRRPARERARRSPRLNGSPATGASHGWRPSMLRDRWAVRRPGDQPGAPHGAPGSAHVMTRDRGRGARGCSRPRDRDWTSSVDYVVVPLS
jgi:Domain of unknown function (DUF4386)